MVKFIFSYVVGCRKKLRLRGARCRKKMLFFEYEMICIVTVKIFLEMWLSEIIFLDVFILDERVL